MTTMAARRVSFRVSGDPVPKGRPRFSAHGHAFTPARTKAYEQEIGWAWRALRVEPFIGAVAVYVIVSEAKHPADLDNYVKVVMDALNGLAFEDDRQVETIHARIQRGRPFPMIEVEVVEVL